MAELGDALSQDDDQTKDVTVDMLDYHFVNECKDIKTLRGVLHVLRSGKEGYYPDVSHSDIDFPNFGLLWYLFFIEYVFKILITVDASY